ncbi:MAG: FtsX-like permease family protein, partial [Eubacteriales bacterium]|nr:FtsX-like permease family protein [Eubacteriales bacterium]
AMDIFGREDVLGEIITFKSDKGDIDLNIVGVEKISENNLYVSHMIYAPILTVMNFGGNTNKNVQNVSFKLDSIDYFNKVEKEVLKALSASHGNDPKKYTVIGNFQFSNATAGMIGMLTIFIGFVAGISLLVGGIGVMNIMLVTVTERTREIGIRKSLGATNGNIKFQFLIESMCISLLGGTIGVILGYLGTFIAKQVLKYIGNTLVPTVSLPVVLAVFIISSLIGIIFGVYPAGKAAKLDPIEALRYE